MGNKDKKKGLTWEEAGEISWENLKDTHPEEYEKSLVKLNKEIDKIKEKVENNYINIIQIVSIVVAVLALVLGNILGFISLPKNINIQRLSGFMLTINGLAIIGISFLMFLIKYLFINSKWEKKYIWIFFIPLIFQVVGIILIVTS